MNGRKHSRGFALVTALLLLLLLSLVAVGVIYSVVTEQALGGNDKESLAAFYGAEAAMEKMMVDIGNLYTAKAAPLTTDITNLAATSYQPTITGITYNTYSFSVPSTTTNGYPFSTNHTITSGSNQGLYAEMVPITLTVDAQRTISGADVQMTRNVDVALIPVFQFGIFSNNDLAYFPTGAFSFGGRVATNGNLYLALAATAPMTFHSKISAYLNIIRTNMPNGQATAAGNIFIPTQSNGCDSTPLACRALATTEGSLVGTVGSSNNANWATISKTTYNGMIVNGATGAGELSLPFVADGFQPIELIRQPWPGELTTSDIYQSRLYSVAQIRVLIQDLATSLPTGGVRLANVAPYYVAPGSGYSGGTFGTSTTGQAFAEAMTTSPAGAAVYETGLGTGCASNTVANYQSNTCFSVPAPGVFSTAGNVTNSPSTITATVGASGRQDFVPPPSMPSGSCANADGTTGCCANLTYTFTNNDSNVPTPSNNPPSGCWPLIDGFLLVQVRHSDGTYWDVTQEWLSLGISRDTGGSMATSNAILHFQTYRDINGDGSIDVDAIGAQYSCSFGGCTEPAYPVTTETTTATTLGNPKSILSDQDPRKYYPIQIYDPREGLFRDYSPTFPTGTLTSSPYYYSPPSLYANDTACAMGGVINLVELDVNNLRRWLYGSLLTPAGTSTGTSVDNTTQNGYIFYYSDRRGMLNNPNATLATGSTGSRQTGGYGFEDIVNNGDNDLKTGAPNAVLETGEDSNSSGTLDTWGGANVANGFKDYNGNVGGSASLPNGAPQSIIPCQVARKNKVTGARHGLRLVNGGFTGATTNLPAEAVTSSSGYTGGFTVVSENPVYVLGNYNASSTYDFTELNCAVATSSNCHVSAAIIADAVTVLSPNWNFGSAGANNAATTTYGIINWGQTATTTSPAVVLYATGTAATPPLAEGTYKCLSTYSYCTTSANIASDWFVFNQAPNQAQLRLAQPAYYRMAVAAGTSVNFPVPGPSGIEAQFGDNGGVQDFLRYLESWNTISINYMGSFVSLYYSEYATGTFKSGGNTGSPGGATVWYGTITRNYTFDNDFLTLSMLPPGTPRFRDVENVGFQQIFSPY